jgi:hypothetical protein
VLLDLLITSIIAIIALNALNWGDCLAVNPRCSLGYAVDFNDLFVHYDLLYYQINFYFVEERPSFSELMLTSTMLTSTWLIFFLISSALAGLLAPIEHIRHFTIWWFKDIDAHPLRAIAKVAAVLILLGAFVLKAIQWVVETGS